MNQKTTKLQTLLAPLKNFCRQLIHLSDNPNLVGRDHRHLTSEYQRQLTAPDLAIHEIARMLASDTYFLEATEDLMGTYLIRACFIGDELRANVYRLERFPGGPLSPVFDHNWRRDGIVHLLFETDSLNGKCVALVNDYQTDMSYDYYEPCLSYVRELSDLENRMISSIARPVWKQAA